MSTYFKFLALYRSRTLNGSQFKVIADPVVIESFNDARSFLIPKQATRIHIIGQAEQTAAFETLTVPQGELYLALTARTKDISPLAISQIENQLDRVVSRLCISLQPHLFFEQIYRGPIFENKQKWWVSMNIRPGEPITPDGNQLHELLDTTNRILRSDPKLDQRYTLMSRFYSRSLQFDPNEEKFLLQWTCLEIYPMCNTSNIAPLVDYLSKIVNKPAKVVKDRLQLGQLYDIRCKLVHDGILETENRYLIFKKLELIVHAIMRCMCNISYDKSLDQYFSQ